MMYRFITFCITACNTTIEDYIVSYERLRESNQCWHKAFSKGGHPSSALISVPVCCPRLIKFQSSDLEMVPASGHVGWYVSISSLSRIIKVLIEQEQLFSNDIDIKDELFRVAADLPPGAVAYEPYFQLLEGTRSIEAGNPVMDTGIIPIDPEDVLFNPLVDISLPILVEIQTQLLTSFVSWLDNSSLSVTVLGCRYVVYFLECYSETKKSIERLQDTLKWGKEERGQSNLHLFLGPFLAALCKAIDFSLGVANAVLYEEEDVTTRTMSLDFLSNIPSSKILAEVDDAISRTHALPDKAMAEALKHTFEVVKGLVKLEDVASLSINLFGNSNLSSLDLMLSSERSAEQLKRNTALTLPKNIFSTVVQRVRNNKTLPLPLYSIPREKALSELGNIFASTYRIAKQASELRSINQVYQFLKYDIELRTREYNVLTRGIFQLFLVRDDRSIFGSQCKLNDFVKLQIEAAVGPSPLILSILHPQNLHAQRISAADWPLVSYNFNDLANNMESVTFELICAHGSNHCRHHQLRSKSLVALDALQVRWESFEYEIFEKYSLGDQTISNDAALPVSSFIYLLKLQVMADVVLLGIGLDIYRDYELYLAYWHASNLIDHQIYHLEARIRLILELRIHHITVILPRRLKKLKGGPKKDAARQVLAHDTEHVLPKIQHTLQCNDEYVKRPLTALRQLVEGRVHLLRAVSRLGICRFDAGPQGSLTTHEHIYDLRLKPFLSIGVPPVPTYQEYLFSLRSCKRFDRSEFEHALATAESTIGKAKKLLEGVLESIRANKLEYFRPSADNQLMLVEYETLIAVANDDLLVVKRLEEVLKNIMSMPISKYQMKTNEGKHRHFPTITIQVKKPRLDDCK